MGYVLIIVAVIGFVVAIKIYLDTKRRERLMAKYGDVRVVDDIMNAKVWQGMSEEQLIESWGRPVAKDHKIFKTKVSETFKYNMTGKNRFGSRVKLENGIVVGWEQK
ncbi:MAG: hypothetical protein P4L72_15830 [Parvibaculum sp.]|uniref:hypothetical protein n=1 Tax=Parvibaculum sp. TaxID=2024848 RepID=UPI00284C661B|nr:hypothetical protein [Parvibaculum sp.]MDR3500684.1 hypothetical protein [Parvibaculum sp.]